MFEERKTGSHFCATCSGPRRAGASPDAGRGVRGYLPGLPPPAFFWVGFLSPMGVILEARIGTMPVLRGEIPAPFSRVPQAGADLFQQM